jgi:hypothetical protein
MNVPSLTRNPYRPRPEDDPAAGPFAGRERIFEQLYRAVTRPGGIPTTLIMGGPAMGKTALLHRFGDVFGGENLGVLLALQRLPLLNERDWWVALATGITRSLVDHDYTLARLPELLPPEEDIRAWFTESYLRPVMGVLRRGHRLLILLDDVDGLLAAVDAGRLPPDTLTFLNSLRGQYPTLGFVLTLDARRDDLLPRLEPLLAPDLTDTARLERLERDEVRWLMNEPVDRCYSITTDALDVIYRATGGFPRLCQRYGAQLYLRWQVRPERKIMEAEDARQVTALVYPQSEAEFAAAWRGLPLDERLVLMATSGLTYDDPLTAASPAAIQTWLAETDYPLETTAIRAAIRGLEYAGWVEIDGGKLRISSGLFQRWLLENARPEATAAPVNRARWPLLLAAVAIIALFIAGLLLLGQSTRPAADSPAPTITLLAPSATP